MNGDEVVDGGSAEGRQPNAGGPKPGPSEIQAAVRAVQSQPVQDLLKDLAKYNLGICLPHMHDAATGFRSIPSGTVQIEVDSEFVTVESAEADGALPVSWRWSGTDVEIVGMCHVLRRGCGTV